MYRIGGVKHLIDLVSIKKTSILVNLKIDFYLIENNELWDLGK